MEEKGIRAWRRERRVSFGEADLGSKVIVPPNDTGRSFQETPGPVRRESSLGTKRKTLESARLQL